MNKTLIDYYRCPEHFVDLALDGELSTQAGFFRLGDTVFYGRTTAGFPRKSVEDDLPNLVDQLRVVDGRIMVPCDTDEVVENARFEQYADRTVLHSAFSLKSLVRNAYYLARPLMPVGFRRHLQRVHLRDWDAIRFPRWPVDTSIDDLMRRLMSLAVERNKGNPVPFIWFWPEGYTSCTVLTHDVETRAGLEFCQKLMDIDDSFGIKASFQLIPEKRYAVSDRLIETIKSRGFEVNVHDLNHDGRLYSDPKVFSARASRINEYCRLWKARGFRSGAMYRNPDWYGAFEFSYDMSIPNVAHLDPQRGGCCTVLPYFIGNVIELPLTTVQDYTLFHILEDYSIDLWKRQLGIIDNFNGLASFIVHPDYLLKNPKALDCYKSLLSYLADRRASGTSWYALPSEVDEWWRTRAALELVESNSNWHIEGTGAEKAVVALAAIDEGRLVFTDLQHNRKFSEANL
ncbi:MAG: hypothetical protein N3B12_00710 [Armatimonadetes bacterium]|nr:hypothetical protein [Armatimonadota bacterium]